MLAKAGYSGVAGLSEEVRAMFSQGSPVLTVGPQRHLSMTVGWPEQGSPLNAGNHSAPSSQDPSFSFAPA